MKRMIIRVLLLSVLLTIALSGSALAMIESGNTCGEHVTWALDEENGVLTVTGEGPMKNDYTTNEYNRIFYLPPWWYRRDEIRSVVIEEGVTDIGQNAFSGCDRMTSVQLPDSLVTIQSGAFDSCKALTEIRFPDGLQVIASGAFNNCTGLKEVTFPAGIREIGGFKDCDSLRSVTIPDGVEYLSASAFESCNDLMTAEIGAGVTVLKGRAFAKCRNLKFINLPDTIEEIESFAFSGCNDLDDVYYAGTEEQWRAVDVSYSSRLITEFGDDVNDALRYADYHFETPAPETWTTTGTWFTDDEGEWEHAMTYVCAKVPALACSAVYDEDGCCLEIRLHELTPGEITEIAFDLPKDAWDAKVFVLDGSMTPLCDCNSSWYWE